MMNGEHSTTNDEGEEKAKFMEPNLLSKTAALAQIAAEILFLAFRQKKIVADSRK